MRHSVFCVMAACAALTACASSAAITTPPPALERISGLWRLPDDQGWVELGPCPERNDQLCGALVGFEGDHSARDYNHPDFWAWGERLCGVSVLESALFDDETGVWRGHAYWREEGHILDAELIQIQPDTLGVLLFDGADLDEGISMAVAALLGSAPDPFDLAYYAARVRLGQDVLSQTQEWKREAPPDAVQCKPDSLAAH